jgi:hypothetical protein
MSTYGAKIVGCLALFAALLPSSIAHASAAVRPLPTPPKYASANYAVAFDVPRNTTYCPLPADWVGSDHGTTIFLTPPKLCGGAGYPSSARGFEPARTPRIEVFYAYEVEDSAPDPCRVAGHARLLGRREALCLSEQDGLETFTAGGTYKADETVQIYLSLVAPAKDRQRYMKPFLALVASVHACRSTWTGSRAPKKSWSTGHGPPCDAKWF